jgi:hypothetical protein
VGFFLDELQARSRHQHGGRSHHNWKRGPGIHAQGIDQRHTWRIESDADRVQGAQDETYYNADEAKEK